MFELSFGNAAKVLSHLVKTRMPISGIRFNSVNPGNIVIKKLKNT
ncbi:MAG TPA: hypothetical protein VN704_03240 [Verrucomicrobiae bacterium]|nr:hypothetical protein [Verrucomicrobiae bacterium]